MERARNRRVTIEVCEENTDGLVAAQRAGADRVELRASLPEGGLTPSWGMIEQARRVATIPFHVIVRPRGGDFLYSEGRVRRHARRRGGAEAPRGDRRGRGLPDGRRRHRRASDAGPRGCRAPSP